MILHLGWYLVALFVLSGFSLLAIDRPIYRKKRMERERKAAFRLGWIQLVLSVTLSLILVTLQSQGISPW